MPVMHKPAVLFVKLKGLMLPETAKQLIIFLVVKYYQRFERLLKKYNHENIKIFDASFFADRVFYAYLSNNRR